MFQDQYKNKRKFHPPIRGDMLEKIPLITLQGVMEKIHADNYKRIARELVSEIKYIRVPIDVSDTKSNSQKAAEKELEKIEKTYPEFLKKLGVCRTFMSCHYPN
jgi:rubrerythrin